MNNELISRRLKEIRTETLRMSQKEFSESLGVSKPLISMWENVNNEKGPSKEMAIKVARLANISVAYVLGESNEKDPNITAKDELEEIMLQIRSKNPEKQKELTEIIKNIMKITGD